MCARLALVCLALSRNADAEPPQSEVLGLLTTTAVSHTPEVPSFHNASWGSPVPNPLAISSPFGPRWKMADARYDFHRGIDYFDAEDTELYAIADGVVFDQRTFYAGGTTTIVEHPLWNPTGAMFHDRVINKVFVYYHHMNNQSTTVGQAVQKGQVIGTMGQTGTTTFTHLHFTTRLVGYCTLQYQVENNREPSESSECATGFDPAVHPYLFVGAEARSGPRELHQVAPKNASFGFAVRYKATRGRLDLDVVETNFGKVSFNTREGVWGKDTLEGLDDLDNLSSWMAFNPGIFQSTTEEEIYYEMHFYQAPAYIEVLDIYGDGIRWESGNADSSSTSMPSTSNPVSTSEGELLSTTPIFVSDADRSVSKILAFVALALSLCP
ncbi:unnamed protein product [Effrenium voratum]|nr:unnamed protein product [Effrenium voratum]